MDLTQFIDALPKAETHLHLEGTVPWSIAKNYAPYPLDEQSPWIHPDYRFKDFNDFSHVMDPGITHMRLAPSNYGSVAAAYFHELMAQNVRYVEVSIGIGSAMLSGRYNVAEMVAAMRAAIPAGLHARIIGGLNRRFSPSLESIANQIIFETPGIDGIDLQSDERSGKPCAFTEIYQVAKERGYLLRAHAGELTGPQTIRDTLDCLQVTRIEHGVTAIQDEELIQRLIAESITLDMCPTSNVKLCVAESLAAHPIGELLRRGVRVTCSTDDPAVFGVSLTDELRNLVTHQNFTAQELAALQINAFQGALLPDDVKASLIAEVEALVQRFEEEAERS